MPILGIIASSFRSAAGPTGAYDSLATVTLSAATTTITFSGIPSGYKHLQLRYNAHIEGTANDYALIRMNLNSDTAANYSYHRLYGSGTSASSDAGTSTNYAFLPWTPDNLTYSQAFGASVVDILDYASTSKAKTIRALGGFDMNGKGLIALFSGLWFKTPEAVTTISLTSNASANFSANSSFALYGVR